MKYTWIIFCILNILCIHYTNAQKLERIHLEFSIPNISDTEDIQVSIPILKYNKRWIFSYTLDDGPIGAYGKILQAVNKKWIDDEQFFHIGQVPTSGYIPSKTLGYTDGCGIEKRLPIGVSIWPNCGNSYNPNFMDKYRPNKYYPYITWEELVPITDFGGSIYFHNVNEDKWNKNIPEEITQGLEEDQLKTYQKLGQKIKAIMRPDGNNNYITAGLNYSPVKILFAEGSPANDIYPLNSPNLYKTVGYRKISTDNLSKDSAWIAQIHNSPNPQWCHIFTHKPTQTTIDLLTTINNQYGKDGTDDIWMASIDEVYEYWYMRTGAQIKKEIEGNLLKIDLIVPVDSNYYFQDLSIILSGKTQNATLVQYSNNVQGISYKRNTNDSILININFNPLLLDRAEKYTHLYEIDQNEDTRNDALYFINQLSPEKQINFLHRLTNPSPAPSITSFLINNGIDNTTSKEVQITFTYDQTPTYYKIGETADLKNQNWQPYKTNTINYQFTSTEIGQKTLYLSIKDNNNYSKIYSAGIELKAPIPMPDNGIHLLVSINPEIESNQSIIYDTLSNNQIINLINPFKPEANLRTIQGDTICKYINNLQLCKGSAGSTNDLYFASSSGNTGILPDKYINRCLYYTNYNQPDEIVPHRLIFMLPNGFYKIKILGSSSHVGASNHNNLFYTANDDIISPNFSMQNNYNKYLTWECVEIDNSYLILRYWSNPTRNNVAPINLVEIQNINPTGDSNIQQSENTSLQIMGEKGTIKIIAPTSYINKKLSIYNVSGEITSSIVLKEGVNIISELPTGVYIVNKQKIHIQ